jgi:hypothetical protein
MSLRNRFALPIIFSSLAILAACGGGGISHIIPPPPSGNFTNSNLNGTYVFSVVGSDVNGSPLQLTGTIAADGNGNLTAGAFDVNNPNGLGVVNLSVGSGSTYNVTADGRGTATVNTSSGNFGFAFVLASSEHGLIIEFDPSGTGSGTLDLQTAVTQTALAQSYAVSLSGADAALNPMASLAGFTLDGAGTISNGAQDINDSATVLPQLTLSGTVLAGAPGAPGTAQFVTPTSLGTLTFDVYAIDANHLKFIETDSVAFFAGDAFPQQTSIPAGTNVFTMSGVDFIAGSPFVAGGFIVTDGRGSVSSTSLEDLNDGGVVTTGLGFAGFYTGLVNGRSTMTLTGFNNASLSSTTTFAVYPSAGGLQILEIDANGITGGVAMQQSSTTLASGQPYGLNLTGANTNGEEDDIAQFTNTNGSFSGLVDFNDQGSLSAGQAFTGNYTADSTNTGRGQISSNAFNLISYVVNNSTSVFIEQDGQVGLGAFQSQDASAKSNLAANHLAALRLKPGTKPAKGNLKRR